MVSTLILLITIIVVFNLFYLNHCYGNNNQICGICATFQFIMLIGGKCYNLNVLVKVLIKGFHSYNRDWRSKGYFKILSDLFHYCHLACFSTMSENTHLALPNCELVLSPHRVECNSISTILHIIHNISYLYRYICIIYIYIYTQ